MLILSAGADRFADSQRPDVTYRLPTALEAATDASGTPAVSLVTHADGGSLSLALAPVWPDFTAHEQPVPVDRARFRLNARTPAGDRIGDWHDAAANAATLVRRTVTLSPVETDVARQLLARRAETFSVDVLITLRGRSAAWPWHVRLPPAVAASLTASFDARADEATGLDDSDIERIFAALDVGALELWRSAATAPPPPPLELLTALAAHARAAWFERRDDGVLQRRPIPAAPAFNLAVPIAVTREVALSWSLNDFLAKQSRPEAFAYALAAPGPFAAADILVTHDLPLSDDGIRRLDVELRTGGPDGEVNHQFTPGQPSAVRKSFVAQTFTERSVRAAVRAVVMKSGQARIVRADVQDVGPTLRIDRALLGIVPVQVLATADAFAHAAAFVVTLGSRTLTLTPEAPLRFAIRSTPAVAAEVTAQLGDGRSVNLGSVSAVNDRVVIDASSCGVDAVEPLVFVRGAAAFRYLAVRTQSGPWRTVTDSELHYGSLRRESRFVPAQVTYRMRYVEGPGTMIETPWQQASTNRIALEV